MELLANLRMARQVLDAVILNQERAEEVLEESLLMLQLGKVNYLDVLVSEANRAEARSKTIVEFHGRHWTCDWQSVVNRREKKWVDLRDPFGQKREVSPMKQQRPRRRSRLSGLSGLADLLVPDPD